MRTENFKYRVVKSNYNKYKIEVLAAKTLFIFDRWFPLSFYKDPLQDLLPLSERAIRTESFLGQSFVTHPLEFNTESEANRAVLIFKDSLKDPERRVFIGDRRKPIMPLEELLIP